MEQISWYYVTEDKTQAGPVDEARLGDLLRAGTITPNTLVWKEGMENWVSYSSVLVRPAHTPVSSISVPSDGMSRCAECGQSFPPDELISLAGRSVCASCKPVAVQKFREGVVSFGRTCDAAELWKVVELRGYDFTIGSVLSRSWALVKGNLWPCVGVTLLCYLILVGSQQIPLLGILAVFLVQPQIMAGLGWYFLKQFRGESATLNDGFEGFRRGYGQQALYMLIMVALFVGLALVLAIPVALIIPAMSSASAKGGGLSGISIGILFAVMVPVVMTIFYFSLSWIFTPLLILDKGLNATAAMKLSRRVVKLHFWKIVGLFVVVALLSMLSLVAFCVGILFMLPIAFATISRLYEDIFNDADSAGKA